LSYELDQAIENIREKYPYGLLVSTRLRERSVDVPYYFGTVPRARAFKEWRFKTLDDRKAFVSDYQGYVLGEIPVSEKETK
jgi:hypothetical protein